MFQITILFLYIIAGTAFTLSRLPRFASSSKLLLIIAFSSTVAGLSWHGLALSSIVLTPAGMSLSLGNTASFIGLQLALIALVGSFEQSLRGLSGGLLILAAVVSPLAGGQLVANGVESLNWQMQAHILISLFAYGLLSVGAIVALYALVQEKRLHAGMLSSVNQLFAPLETTERLLFGIAAAGFAVLALAVFSGSIFVDDLFDQHLVHKTALSLLALVLFGVLVAGRMFAGWRGKRAVYLYLWGFLILCLAYFGSRYILEEILGRSWG